MYSIATIVNNTVIAYLKVAERVDFKSSNHKKKHCNYVWEQTLTRITVVIILQYIQI